MSPSDDDHLVLKRRLRRDQASALAILIVVLPLWWYAYHWIEHRFAIDEDLTRYGGLAIIVGGCWVARALGLDERRPADPESMQLRRLAAQRDERRRDRFRWLWVVSLGFLLLALLPAQPNANPELHPGHLPTVDWEVASITLFLLTSTSFDLPIRCIVPADTAALSRQLAALRLGFATILLLGVAALILDGYRPGTLPRTLPIALVLGLLAQQIHLMLRRPAAAIPGQP